jgi:hypothetical protein
MSFCFEQNKALRIALTRIELRNNVGATLVGAGRKPDTQKVTHYTERRLLAIRELASE